MGFEPEQVPTARKPASNLGFEIRTKSAKSGGSERIGLRRAIFGRLRAGPVNMSALKTPGNLPLSVAPGRAESTSRMETGGWRDAGNKCSLPPDISFIPLYQLDTTSPPTCCGAVGVCRNVKHWRNAAMALRWTGAAMQEAAKGFRRLKAHKQLPVLQAALLAIQAQQDRYSHGNPI